MLLPLALGCSAVAILADLGFTHKAIFSAEPAPQAGLEGCEARIRTLTTGFAARKAGNRKRGMSTAAIRVLFFILLAVGGVSSGAAAAGAQVIDPIGTVTSAISTITSQTTIVSDLTDGVSGGGSGS